MTLPQPDEEDQRRLVELLRRLGATDAELDATPVHQRSALALELSLREGRPRLTLAQAADRLGASREELATFWRALGFATDDTTVVPGALVEAQQVLVGAATTLIGEEAALGLMRVVGSAAARLADAVVDVFRVGFELPELGRGTRYSDVVQSYVEIAAAALPAFEDLLRATLRAHLVRVAAGAWAPDEAGTAARRDLAVGFADLVGYTALARTMSAAELATMLRRFEDTVVDVLDRHRGRLVKQIGDGVMFVTEDPADAAGAGVELVAALTGSAVVPPVRVGIAAGPVLTRYGDYYGDVVNLAARLVALAAPGTVVASGPAADAAALAGRQVERLPDQALKGFGAPAAVFRVLPAPA